VGILILISAFLWLFGGCASSQQEKISRDRLESARKTYGQVKANPNVEAYASVPLLEAGKALEAAEKAKDYKQRRAESVKEALTGKGVGEERITTRGYGKKYPVASNDTPSGR